MSKIYIGIDNGVTGTIGIVQDGMSPLIYHTPVKKEQNYTKKKDAITRLDANGFSDILKQFDAKDVMVVMERPMVNPTRFKATTSALRCFEAELTLIEHLGLPYCYVDSKEWQGLLKDFYYPRWKAYFDALYVRPTFHTKPTPHKACGKRC